MSWRQVVSEIDLSGFAATILNVNGFMVVRSPRGRGDKAIKCQSEEDVLKHFWQPSADYPDLFEAAAYCKKAPCYITSAIGDNATYGGINIKSGVAEAFSSGIAAAPDDYTYSDNTISHSFFANSQYDDDLKADVSHTTGYQFKLTLYRKKIGKTTYENITYYDYSLIREKNNEGRSLYIHDIFDDNSYIISKINSGFTLSTGVFDNFVDTTDVVFDGGSRGDTPTEGQVTTAWDYAKRTNKYPARILMDVIGNDQTTLNTIINTYTNYSHGISVIPFGTSTVSDITTARGALDTDNVSKYCNWTKIKDTYNDSYAWISSIGSIGGKYVLSSIYAYGAESPAGIDENGKFGGQLSDWTYIETEQDFSEGVSGDTQTLDEAQINPFVLDPDYGLVAMGDRTMQVSNSDTSYTGARRLYNYVIENITKQILRKQEFKINDPNHRLRAQVQVESFLTPIVAAGYFREVYVLCDDTNNTDDVLDRREFKLAIYEKVTTNTQRVLFDFVRVAQGQVIAELLP